jgi:DNA (cytosine-5)-methyltransferase 1
VTAPDTAAWTFIDLFAGIGGFHAALSALGGRCEWASEIDGPARDVYERNWGVRPAGDIRDFTKPTLGADGGLESISPAVPKGFHVLAAGFPCQPFSKSGAQHGFRDATRGTLFFDICEILAERKPPVLILENVRNLAGPRHTGPGSTWSTIIERLRELGYRVSSTPTVFSPHLLPETRGGAAQVRERVFITGTYVGPERATAEIDLPVTVPNRPIDDHDPQAWDIRTFLDEIEDDAVAEYRLRPDEEFWVECWNDFVERLLEARAERLPGHPLWLDNFEVGISRDDILHEDPEFPRWKADFLEKNSRFYERNRAVIDNWRADWFPNWTTDWRSHGDERRAWTARHEVRGEFREVFFPLSRRKLEWQAQDEPRLWDTLMHFRPSGIRAKRPTYVPAMVAITQTSIYGPWRRRLTPREAARLQGLPDWFKFEVPDGRNGFVEQPDPVTYKQLGNGVNVGAVYHVLREHVLKDLDLARDYPEFVARIARAGEIPIVPEPGKEAAALERRFEGGSERHAS